MSDNSTPAVRFAGFTNDWEQRKPSHAVPAVRFQADDGSAFPEWEEKKLGDVLEVCHGRDYKHLGSGNIPVMGTGGVITYVDEALCNWDCVCIGRKGTINKPIYMNVPFWSVDTLFFSKAKKDNDPLCQFYLFQTINWDRYNEATGVPSLSSTTIESLKVNVPSFPEQQKIASLLSSVDETITLCRRKLDLLTQAKKALMQQIFSQKLRFKADDGSDFPEWEKKKLGDIAEIVRGASPRPINDPKWFDNNSDVGWLRISDVTDQHGRIHYLQQHISQLGQEKTRVVTEPHLLLSIAATVGKPLINYVKTGVHDGFLIFLHPQFDLEYMYQWLEVFRPQWNKYGQPGTQVNLNSDLVKNQTILLPSDEEQKTIGSFLKRFDSVVDQARVELEQWQEVKKSLLQQLFV